MSVNNINSIDNTKSNISKNAPAINSLKKDFSAELNNALQNTTLDNIFQEASNKHGVSVSLLKAVAKAESNFNANAQSHAGAQGIMQLMPSTSKSLGVTDPFDAYQNIMGGAKLLSQFINKYDGNISLALAAYNAGPGNVAKYGGIPPFKETQNYVKKVLGYCDNTISIDPNKNAYASIPAISYNKSSNYNYYSKNIGQIGGISSASPLDSIMQLLNSSISSNLTDPTQLELDKILIMNFLQSQFQNRPTFTPYSDDE